MGLEVGLPGSVSYQLLGAAPGPTGGGGPRQVRSPCPQEAVKEDFGNHKEWGIGCQEDSDPPVLGMALPFPQHLGELQFASVQSWFKVS